MNETLIQFREDQAGGAEGEPPSARICPDCGQHFSGDARFCPFDGVPLGAAPNWDPRSDPLIGSVVDGRYEVEAVLGEGGMGTVYRVRHQALGKSLALKALRHDIASDAELSARFIQEAKAAAAVSHPNVVQITDFGRLESGQPYFVMEMLEGLPLSLVIRAGPVAPERTVTIVRQVADALAAAHAAGIIHRDLKPDNIHVSPGDVVRVLDFGLAKVAGASKLTRAGMVFGTPHYMSPEQAAGEAIDQRSDLYALGIVMYQMLTGRVPFEADSFMGVLTKHMYVEPIAPSQVVGDTPELGELEAVVLKCLQKKPSNRFANMVELSDALDRVVAGTPLPRKALPKSVLQEVLQERESAPVAPLPKIPLWPLAAAAVGAAVVVIGVLAWWLIPSDGNADPDRLTEPETPSMATSEPRTELEPALEPPPEPEAEPASEPEAPLEAVRPTRPRSTLRKAPAPSAPESEPKPRPKPKPKLGAGEIIDPWAE